MSTSDLLSSHMSYEIKLGWGGTYKACVGGIGGTLKEHNMISVQGSFLEGT